MRLTISEAAAHCGYRSRTVIYRLQRDGLLRDYEAGKDGRSQLLESHPPGRCPLRDHIAACVQLRHDSPLAQRHRAEADPLAEMTDAQLAAYADAHLGDEVLAAAMAPINEWADSLQEPDWPRIAELANASLDCASWGPPPWAPQQWVTLAMVLSLAEEGAADG
jgi:hypothetical protein